MSLVVKKRLFAYAKTKTQISFAVTVKLISAFVFATRIVQYLLFLNFKHLAIFRGCRAWFMSDLVGNPEDRFSHNEAHICPLGHCLALHGLVMPNSDLLDRIVYPIYKLMIDSYILTFALNVYINIDCGYLLELSTLSNHNLSLVVRKPV